MGVYVFTNQRMRTPGADIWPPNNMIVLLLLQLMSVLLVPNTGIWDTYSTAFPFLCFATEWLWCPPLRLKLSSSYFEFNSYFNRKIVGYI